MNSTVILYKAPQDIRVAQRLVLQGFLVADFSMAGGDNSAYLAKTRSIAEEFNAVYNAGILEIEVPTDLYNQRLAQHEVLYQGGPRIEVVVPHRDFGVLNQCNRILVPQ